MPKGLRTVALGPGPKGGGIGGIAEAGYSETQCCSRSSQPLMMCHLSRPLDWKSRRSDLLSCNSKKNFSVSRPLAWLGSMDCVRSQRSHSWVIRIFASFCFIYARPIDEPLRALVVALVFAEGRKKLRG